MPNRPDIVESSEDALLKRLRPWLARGPIGSYSVAVGDDAAVRRTSGESLVLTTDSLVENVHFDLAQANLVEVGYKAMAVNLSDCAAMGATPDSALVELVIPSDEPNPYERTRSLYQGFSQACRRWHYPIVGGNIARGPCWMISITLLGSMPPGAQPLRRTTARPGQKVWTTGPTGLSAAGLAALRHWERRCMPRRYAGLVSRHLRPRPRLETGQALAGDRAVTCAMDISDGVSVDCARMARASGVGMVLYADAFRAPPTVRELARELGIDPLEWMLHGGEDYELLFTAPANRDYSTMRSSDRTRTRCIGETRVKPPGVYISHGGAERRLGALGWDHLKSALPMPHQRS